MDREKDILNILDFIYTVKPCVQWPPLKPENRGRLKEVLHKIEL